MPGILIPVRVCLVCGAEFVPKPTARRGIYCSVACRQRGIARSTAKIRGDAQRHRGVGKTYTKVEGRHEHRSVMEQKIGRKLTVGEIVHHINGNKKDNRPENLEVMTQAEHARLHFTKNRKCEISGCGRKHSAKGLCSMHYQRKFR